MRADMVASYVRDLVEHLTGTRPQPDPDGDLEVSFGGADFYVRVIPGPQTSIVQIFSVAVADVPSSPELFADLNEINTRISFARAFHVADQVLIETEILGPDINPGNFRHACRNVAEATDSLATPLAEKHGGTPRFARSQTPGYGEGPLSSDAPGFYL